MKRDNTTRPRAIVMNGITCMNSKGEGEVTRTQSMDGSDEHRYQVTSGHVMSGTISDKWMQQSDCETSDNVVSEHNCGG